MSKRRQLLGVLLTDIEEPPEHGTGCLHVGHQQQSALQQELHLQLWRQGEERAVEDAAAGLEAAVAERQGGGEEAADATRLQDVLARGYLQPRPLTHTQLQPETER
jgi:hypothetical protein